MSTQWTTDYLLSQIKRKAFIPSSQSTFDNSDLLALATDELQGILVPEILSVREEYYVYKHEVTLNGSVTDQVVDIPARAVGMQLREVSVTVGGVERNMPRYDIEDRIYNDVGGNVYGFDITNNQLTIKGSQPGTLNLYYYLQPGTLIQTSAAGRITNIDTANKQVTVSNLPSDWTTSTEFDFIKHKPGFDNQGADQTISAIDSSGLIITFDDDLPDDIVVNDWLCEASFSPVPQIPVEFFQYLAEAVVAVVMESQGDQEGFVRAERRKNELKGHALKIISPRVDGQSMKFVPRNNRGSHVYTQWRNK